MGIIVLLALLCGVSSSQDIPLVEGEAIAGVYKDLNQIRMDLVEHSLLQGKLFKDEKLLDIGSAEWGPIEIRKGEKFRVDCYLHFEVDSDQEKVMILEAGGHSHVFVNGTPRMGNPHYGVSDEGRVPIPVKLKEGTNHLLFLVRKGNGFKATLKPVEKEVSLSFVNKSKWEPTLPSLISGRKYSGWGGVDIINAGDRLTGLKILARVGDREVETSIHPIHEHSISRASFRIKAPASNKATLHLELKNSEEVLDSLEVPLEVVNPKAKRVVIRKTFRSSVDGSIQSYRITPAKNPEGAGILVACHDSGRGTKDICDMLPRKKWCHIVAPMNRRPIGFSYEDWGRLDVLEALEDAKRQLPHDPKKIYICGLGMGGHGAWAFMAWYPGMFAAGGPSGGYLSIWDLEEPKLNFRSSRTGEILWRSCSQSRIKQLWMGNLSKTPVYVLHGQLDRTVRVHWSRRAVKLLKGHPNLKYHEEKGASHRWKRDGIPFMACVNWPQMFKFLRKQQIGTGEKISFTTANPGVSSQCHWVGIEQQKKFHKRSKVTASKDGDSARVTTTNVQALWVDAIGTVRLDKQSFEVSGKAWFRKKGGKWSPGRPPQSEKSSLRTGPFKEAFTNEAVLVYGTQGSDEESKANFEAARFHQETFFYHGNGNFPLIPDEEYKPGYGNIILYGNSRTNSAWEGLLGGSPVQVGSTVKVRNKRELTGDLAVLLVRPKPGCDTSLVGVVSGTTAKGMRMAGMFPIFTAGIGYPDLVIADISMLDKENGNVKFAGFFGNDWSVENGEFVGE
ncbi:MAG: hypothetical protein ISS93_00025 [Candidatus Aenigmarchaeota archaeon]|nr:hypothetical protein [Candidatus Aenigmarchaeota archaeon]